MSKATNQLDKILSRLSKAVKESVDKKSMDAVGKFTADLIVKRTLLGYGVDDNLGDKKKLKALSSGYVKQRSMFAGLSGNTTPKRSNLTRTGQMLSSVKHRVIGFGQVVIEPTGTRSDGKKNKDIASYNADRGRIFNRISRLEYQQALRFYRKTFGDLLRLRKLIK